MSTANLAAMLAGNARRFADADALVFADRRWTHRQLDDDVNALAAGLTAEGYAGTAGWRSSRTTSPSSSCSVWRWRNSARSSSR